MDLWCFHKYIAFYAYINCCKTNSSLRVEIFEHFLNTETVMKSSKPLSISICDYLKRFDSGLRHLILTSVSFETEVFCCIFSRNKSAAGTQIRSFSAFSFYIRLFRNLSGRSCDTQIFRISVIRRKKKGMGISLYFLCRGYQTARADISLHLAHNHLFVFQLLFQSNGSTVSC